MQGTDIVGKSENSSNLRGKYTSMTSITVVNMSLPICRTYGSRKSAGTGGAWSRFSFGGTSACYGEKITLSKVQEEDNENEEDDIIFNIPVKHAEEQQSLNEEVLEIHHAGTSKDIIEASKTKSIQGKSALAKEKRNQENLDNQEGCTESVRGKEEGEKSENGALNLEGGNKVRRGEKRKKNGRRGDKKSERLSEMPKSVFEDAKQEDAVCVQYEERSVAHWSPLSVEGDGKHEGEDESAASLPVEVKTKVDRVDTSSQAAISKARSIPSEQAATQNIRAAGTRNGHKTTIMRVEVSPTTENPFTSPKGSWPNSSFPSAKQFSAAFSCMSATKMREQDLCALVSPLAPISGNVVKSKGGRGLEKCGLEKEGDMAKIASAVANTAEWMQKEMEKDIEMRFKEKGRGKQDTGSTALKATAQSTRKGNVLGARAGGGGKKVHDEKTEQLVKQVKVFRDVDLRVITKKGTRDETMTVHGTRGVDKQVDSVQEEGGRDLSTEGRGISPPDRPEKGGQKKVRRSAKEKRGETQQAVKTRQEQISRKQEHRPVVDKGMVRTKTGERAEPCGRAPEKMFTAMSTKQRQNAGSKKMSVSGMEAKTKSNASLGIWRRVGMGGERSGFNTSLERLALGDEEDVESVSEEDTG